MTVGTSSRVVGVVFILFALVFVAIGGFFVWSQHIKITTYRPVEASILSSRVATIRGSKSTTYKPIVEYRYKVGGQTFQCHSVLPVNQSSGYRWAHTIIARYAAGQHTTAYYDPHQPDQAFLDRHYTFVPYVFVLFPMLFIAVGIGVTLAGKTSRPVAALERLPDGWFRLEPTTRVADRLRAARIVALVWCGVGGVVMGHYFSVADRPYETLGLVTSSIYGTLAVVVVGMAAYYARLLRNIGDAEVSLSVPSLTHGEPFKVRVVQAIHENLQIQELQVGIECVETDRHVSGGKTRITSRTRYEDKLPVVGADYVRAGQSVKAVAQLTIPAGQPASQETGYPRYAWFIVVNTRIADSPDYRAKFPLAVT